jgi:hypothetical protein
MKRILALVVAANLGCAGSLFAADLGAIPSVQQSLMTVPAAEMPAKAAELIKTAKVRDRGTVTVDVVTAAAALNPACLPTVVGSIAKSVPDMASIAAGTAAELQPKQAADIARVATTIAPSKAGKIVTAVCRAVPQDYKKIALAAAQAAPSASKEILQALETAIPGLKTSIQPALAGPGDNPPSVPAVLDSIRPAVGSSLEGLAADSPRMPGGAPVVGSAPMSQTRGPLLAPPFVPISGTSTNVNPATSGNVPRGGRNYASP